jgi:hypothetical protein
MKLFEDTTTRVDLSGSLQVRKQNENWFMACVFTFHDGIDSAYRGCNHNQARDASFSPTLYISLFCSSETNTMKSYSTTNAAAASASLMLLLLNTPGALASDSEPKLRGAVYLESDANIQASAVTETDMNGLVDAFCGAAVAISEAFWNNGGKSHSEEDAYPQAACDAAYNVALGALNGAYNYPDLVLFKPTLTTAPYTFRPTKSGALSYFIGTDCLLKSGDADLQFPQGNDGSAFKEYGFALANYRTHTGISGCKWVPDSFVSGESVGVAQGQVIFERNEGATSVVDKTFSFGFDDQGNIVITGHHSSSVIGAAGSTQYV